LWLNDIVTHRKAYEVANGVDIQLEHHSGPVGFSRFDAYAQDVRHFLVALALR
jgi:hypothetical protein